MGSTTLVTFLLQTPPSTHIVELVGSWDNFTRSYRLERDLRMGRGYWRGCHSFRDIICDGDSERTVQSRNGGLKMGGTYWYFYRLDGDTEICNNAEPSTTSCPFLPGQEVNLLDVPKESEAPKGDRSQASDSSLLSGVFTLDPEEKFRALKPKACMQDVVDVSCGLPKPSSAGLCAQSSALLSRPTDYSNRIPQEDIKMPLSICEGQRGSGLHSSSHSSKESPLMTIFHRIRGTRSAEYGRERKRASAASNSGGELSSAAARRPKTLEKSTEEIGLEIPAPSCCINSPAHMTLLARFLNAFTRKSPEAASSKEDFNSTQQRRAPVALGAPPNSPTVRSNKTNIHGNFSEQRQGSSNQESIGSRLTPSFPPLTDESEAQVTNVTDGTTSHLDENYRFHLSDVNGFVVKKISSTSQGTNQLQPETSPNNIVPSRHRDNVINSGSSSECCLSEPGSPLWLGFDQQYGLSCQESDDADTSGTDEELAVSSWQPQRNRADPSIKHGNGNEALSQGCFLGYSLPVTKSSSVPGTKLPKIAALQPQYSPYSFPDIHSDDDRLQILGDGSGQQPTAAEQLIGDLRYLGEAIV